MIQSLHEKTLSAPVWLKPQARQSRFNLWRGAGLITAILSIMRQGERSPLQYFALILSVVFAIELVIMAALPLIFPARQALWLESVLDSVLLTIIAAPILWRLIVHPLKALAKSRRDLLAAMIRDQEEERRRIARDLHDEMGQSITSILVGLRNIEESSSTDLKTERVQIVRQIATQLMEDVRRLSRGLRPSVLDDLGLRVALERLATDFSKTTGIAIELNLQQLEGCRFTPEIEIGLYRIVQEALNNIAKHAKATRAQVIAAVGGRIISISVSDDGIGFGHTDSNPSSIQTHIGLSSMRERSTLMKGCFELESKPGRGTTIKVSVPIAEHADGQDANSAGR